MTVDVEEDISNYLSDSYVGIEQGIPWLLELLHDMGFKACFFILGHVCERFPGVAREIAQEKHEIGIHGFEHETLYYRSARWQFDHLGRATRSVELATKTIPRFFRATKFSATSRTIRVLERLGYLLDSSILPDTKATRFRGKFVVRSTEGAPHEPYHPDRRDILRPGDSPLWEVPLTLNPITPGIPLTMGGLNTFGVDRMKHAIRQVKERNVIFLIHPWECVDLGARYPGLKEWVKKLCAPNRDELHELLSEAERAFHIGGYSDLELPGVSGD